MLLIVKTNLKSGFVYGCIIFATIIGAGFASGKEVWYYFARYGGVSYPMIVVMGLLFFVLCFLCLEFGRRFEISAVKQMNYVVVQKFSFVAELVLCLSNFIILSTMFAGADSLFFESFGGGFYRFGSILTAIVSILIVWLGLKKLIKVNLVIVPGMLIIVVVVLLNCVFGEQKFDVLSSNIEHNILYAFLNSVSFIVSNLFFGGFMIAKLGNGANKKINLWGSFFGTLFMLICIFCMITIIYFNPSSFAYDMPLVYVANSQNFVLGIFAKIVVWLGIATTAISLLYQVVNWLESYFGKHKIIGILVSILAILFSNIGFDAMINYFYPLLGFFGFVFMIFMSKRMASVPKYLTIKKV